MNRPIKFRVWLPSLNRFSDDNSVFINCYGKLYGVTKPSLVDDSQSIVNIGQFKELDGYTIQWYTGLNDKNNKEIFEGDIINFIPFGEKHTRVGVIVFENACYMAKSFNDVPQGYHIYFHDSEPEVVGNIYDLPCKPDHNGECMLCDELCSDCPFRKLN